MLKPLKLFLALIAVACVTASIAQRVQVVDWVNNPFHPVPYSYTTNHFKLSGKVKSMSEMWTDEYSGGKMTMIKFEFSPEGEIRSQRYSSGGKETRVTLYKDTIYSYNPQGFTVKEASTFNGETTNTDINYFRNLITVKTLFAGTTTLYEKSVTKYTHNDKGLLTEYSNYDLGKQGTREKYEYNTTGQLVKSTLYFSGDKPYSSKEIVYKKEGKLLVVSTWYRFTSGNDYEIIDVFNESGLLIKSSKPSDKKETIYEYTLDKNSNWTKRVQTEKNLVTGTQKVSTRYRTVGYY